MSEIQKRIVCRTLACWWGSYGVPLVLAVLIAGAAALTIGLSGCTYVTTNVHGDVDVGVTVDAVIDTQAGCGYVAPVPRTPVVHFKN